MTQSIFGKQWERKNTRDTVSLGNFELTMGMNKTVSLSENDLTNIHQIGQTGDQFASKQQHGPLRIGVNINYIIYRPKMKRNEII